MVTKRTRINDSEFGFITWARLGKGRSQEWTITTEEQLVTKNTHD